MKKLTLLLIGLTLSITFAAQAGGQQQLASSIGDART